MKCAAAARNVLRATAFLVKQGCSACSRSHLLPDTTEGETLREDVLFLARSRSSKCETAPTFQKMIQDCLSQLQLLRLARRLPQGRCHFAEQLEQRTLWYRRATAVCVRTR
jgi:hypothetical protein